MASSRAASGRPRTRPQSETSDRSSRQRARPRRPPRDDAARREDAEQLPLEPRRERRALSHVGGHVELRGGDTHEQAVLRRALAVKSAEKQVMADVHGFHSYPARLHPLTASRLVEGFSQPGDGVVDPFCGSGTVLVEARALGRRACGSDLNPLAVELAWLKTRGIDKRFSEGLLRYAEAITDIAEERRFAKAEPHQQYSEEDREKFPIHMLLEIDSLLHGIMDLRPGDVQRALRLVLSSILTKVAYSEGDTTRRKSPRRLPSGFAISLFSQKTDELIERLHQYTRRLAPRAPRAYLEVADARRLRHVNTGAATLVVTSPPYAGVYDYLDHHLHRIRLLGLDPSRFGRDEIGARRVYRKLTLRDAASRFQDEMGHSLREMHRVLAPGGRAVVVVADSVIGRSAFRADAEMIRAAERHRFEVRAIASQERPLFLQGANSAFRSSPRREHVVLLCR